MDIIMQVQDFDDGDSLLGFAGLMLRGFPAEALLGLYVFEDGSVGAAYPGPAPDLTTNHKNAAVAQGAAQRIAAGVATSGTGGFVFDTGIPYATGSFTAFGVFANQRAIGSSEVTQQMWGPVPFLTGGSSAGVALQDRFRSDYHILRMIAKGGWSGLSGDRDGADYFDTPTNDYRAWAVIWNAATGTMQLRFRAPAGRTATFAAEDMAKIASGMPNVLGNHGFAIKADGAAGAVGLAGIFGAALTINEVDNVLSNARAIVAARGVTVS
ncbi:hypothetical protein [Sphingomonas parapaucimobilis]|uniref:hypothetical protein n=1 Tax=Sphingomonas parapaucimobilis TaxID=28213 RepID=UPI00321BA5D5